MINIKIVIPEISDLDKIPFCDANLTPKTEGVYFLFKNSELIYIGKSENLRNRLLTHNHDYDYVACVNSVEQGLSTSLLEILYIEYYKPILNKTEISDLKIPKKMFALYGVPRPIKKEMLTLQEAKELKTFVDSLF